MEKANAAIVIGGAVALGAVVVWWSRRGVAGVAGELGPIPSLVPPPPVVPENVQAPPSTASQVAKLTIATASAVLPAILAPAAVVPAAAAVVPTTIATTTVGGSTVGGSVAASQAATAAATQTTPAGSAVAGGGLSGMAIGVTIGIAAAIIVGVMIWRARRNETKSDREDFAESLGFYDEGPGPFGKPIRQGNVDKLFNEMRRYGTETGTLDVAGELINRALNVIGKHDRDANVRWMHDVYRFFGVEPVVAGFSQQIDDAYNRPFDDEETIDAKDEPELELT